jgi:hypothetical protein
MRIILKEYKCPSWNILYGGMHWSKRSEMAEYAHESVREALLGQKWTVYRQKVKITITAYLKRTIDPDNVSAKLIIDGLKIAGLIKDDTFNEIDSVTTRVIKSKADFTVIEIEAYE